MKNLVMSCYSSKCAHSKEEMVILTLLCLSTVAAVTPTSPILLILNACVVFGGRSRPAWQRRDQQESGIIDATHVREQSGASDCNYRSILTFRVPGT